MKNIEEKKVSELVAENFEYATVFQKYKIDFCCHGNRNINEVCKQQNIDVKQLESDLDGIEHVENRYTDFKTWDVDLLVDYIIKFHHRRLRQKGAEISALFDKVCRAHQEKHPYLIKLRNSFNESLSDLLTHLDKEEMVLYPYVYEAYEAYRNEQPIPTFHCGEVTAPISVMMDEHSIEGERFEKMRLLSNNYTVPDNVCNSFRLLYAMIQLFEADLHHHIHLENNILFPAVIQFCNE